MADVLLINLWNCLKYFGNYKVHENLGLEYIDTYLSLHQVESDFYDPHYSDLNIMEKELKEKGDSYCLIGLSIHENNYFMLAPFVKLVRKLYPNAHIVLGGMFATFNAERLLVEIADINSILIGEGEESFYLLFQKIKNNENWKSNASIAYIENNKYICNEFNNNFDFTQIKSLKRYIADNNKLAKLHINATRGCNKKCSFCSAYSFSALGDCGIRLKDAYDLVKEFHEIYEKYYPFRKICIVDDNFLANHACKKRAYQFAKIMREKKLYIPFKIDVCVESVEQNLFRELRDVGLCEVLIGVESFSEHSLAVYNKGITSAQIIHALNILTDLKIHTRIAWVMFHPYVTNNDLKINLNFLKNTNLFWYLTDLIGAVRLQKGTSLYEKAINDNLTTKGFPYLGWKFEEENVREFYNYLMQPFFKNLLLTAHNITFFSLRQHTDDNEYNWYLKTRECFIEYMDELLNCFKKSKRNLKELDSISQKFKSKAIFCIQNLKGKR